jgi:hypothetical protein
MVTCVGNNPLGPVHLQWGVPTLEHQRWCEHNCTFDLQDSYLKSEVNEHMCACNHDCCCHTE